MAAVNISDPAIHRALSEAAKWSKRLGILNYVLGGLTAFATLGALVMLGSISAAALGLPNEVGIEVLAPFILLGIAVAGLYIYIGHKLHRFGQSFTMASGERLTNARLELGFEHFGSLFKFAIIATVVLTILSIGLSLYLLASVLA